MLDFIKSIIASMFGGVTVRTRSTNTPSQGGYYEGDDSPWIMGDNGPIYTGRR